jgi:hypothetical protein
MTLEFVSSPGFAIAKPEAVFPAVVKRYTTNSRGLQEEKEIQASCSFVLTKLTLSSTSLGQTSKIQEVIKSLKDKYKDYELQGDNSEAEQGGYLIIKDTSGSTIEANWKPDVEERGSTLTTGLTLSITYSFSTDQLDQLYQSHLSDLENKSSSKKPDQSSQF